MDFRILGPLEAYDGESQLQLGGTRQRALLGMLLLHAGEVVSSDRLVTELWGGEGSAEGSKALQVAISRLRKALDATRAAGETSRLIVTRPPGYELRLEPERLDLGRFEALAEDGRRALAAGDSRTAASKLSDALRLWRGPPLADLAYEQFCQGEIARLEELRVATLEDRIAADMELGRHVELVAELGELVSRHPLRERLRGQLILALYRSGRQAEALEAYADARRALVDELGIEPSRELQELQQAVLAQEPALDLQPPSEGVLPEPSRGTFVGRERELAVLEGALVDALGGNGRLVLLAGEPGIGKSRLAEELIGEALARGSAVLVGRCWEAGGAPAYWPWVQALRAYIREAEPGALRAQVGTGAADLAQILPELREIFPGLPELPRPESEGARFRLFEAVSGFLRNAARGGPLVLILDDLHAADEPSLLLLQFVAREMASSRLLLVCAYRDVDPTLGDPLTGALAELAREPHTAHIGLAGLSDAHVSKYVELAAGIEPPRRLVSAIHTETEGNPLFVAEIVRLLASEGRMADADAHLRIPPGVRAVIGERVKRLSAPCRKVLIPAAVMGREFEPDVLARLSGLSGHELLDVLDEAIAERVVSEVPGSPGQLRFGHALIRDTLYDELASTRRIQLHREVVAAVETVYAADLEPHLAELAHHAFAAAPAGVAEKAVEYARRAGNRAASQLAHEEAVRLYAMALTRMGDDAARCELLLSLGDAQARAGDAPSAQRSFLEAADLAEALGLSESLARAALGYGGRHVWEVLRGDANFVPLLERALTAVGEQDSIARVRLLARFAGGPLRDASFPPERRRRLSEEALAMARRVGDPGAQAYALSAFISAHHSPAFTPDQVALGIEVIQLAEAAGDLERAAEGYEHRASGLIELGDMPSATAELATMGELAKALRQPSHDWYVAAYHSLIALLEGELAEAERLIEDARRLGAQSLSWGASVSYGLQLYVLRRNQGRLEDAEDVVRRSAEEHPTYPVWRCVLAQTLAELGHSSEARDLLETMAADGFAGLPFDEEWLVGMSLLADAADALEDTTHAAALYDALLPFADRVAISYPEISTGPVARPLGLMAAQMERWDDAERHFEHALEIGEQIGAKPWLAYTRANFADMLLARGTQTDRANALELQLLANAMYRELGMRTTTGRQR